MKWHQFLSNLQPEQLDYLLASGHHVCRVTLEPVPGTYDAKQRGMKLKCKGHTPYGPNVPVPVWEWHVLMSDGAVYRFHTDYNAKTVSMARVEPRQQHPPPPQKGMNESDGLGLYKLYKICNYEPRLPAENRDDKVWSGGGDGGGGGGGGDDGNLTVVAEEDDGTEWSGGGGGAGQDSKEQIATRSGSDATHGCGAIEIVWKKGVDAQTQMTRKKHLQQQIEEIRTHIEKLRSLPKHNKVNYVVNKVPVPPASDESNGTQQPIEIHGWGTLVPDESAVAGPGRKWVEGACYNK